MGEEGECGGGSSYAFGWDIACHTSRYTHTHHPSKTRTQITSTDQQEGVVGDFPDQTGLLAVPLLDVHQFASV